MTELIRRMSQVQVPDDLLRQVNMDGLIDDFRKNFKRLDDFKKTRSRHEERNYLSKWWNSDELENAQLDAVETQAAFSKAIGQLMVLSIIQSQKLQSQQEQLSLQQGVIKDQTQRIERHTLELKEQQELLAKQNTDLEKLVKDYFELRGLTQEGAKKLIAIANEVQGTRDALLRSVEESLLGVLSQLDDALSVVNTKTLKIEAHVNHQNDALTAQYGEVSASLQKNNVKLEEKIGELQQLTAHANQLIDEFGGDLASQRTTLSEFAVELARIEAHVNHQNDVLTAQYGEVSISLQKNNVKWEEKIGEFQQLTAHANQLIDEFGGDLALQRTTLSEFGVELARQEEKLNERSSDAAAKIDEFGGDLASQRATLNGFSVELARQEKKLNERSSDAAAKIESIAKDFAAYRNQAEARFKKLYFGLGLLTLGVVGSVVLASTKF